MIQDGFYYGDGYEKATEPGDNLEFWRGEKWIPRHDQQECLSSCYKYRKPIKPKDEKMEEHLVRVNAKNLNFASWQAELTLDEAEKAGEEAKRIKAEIAKREEIGPEDWAMCNDDKKIVRIAKVDGDMLWFKSGRGQVWLSRCHMTKLHPTPDVRAWLDKTIGGEG